MELPANKSNEEINEFGGATSSGTTAEGLRLRNTMASTNNADKEDEIRRTNVEMDAEVELPPPPSAMASTSNSADNDRNIISTVRTGHECETCDDYFKTRRLYDEHCKSHEHVAKLLDSSSFVDFTVDDRAYSYRRLRFDSATMIAFVFINAKNGTPTETLSVHDKLYLLLNDTKSRVNGYLTENVTFDGNVKFTLELAFETNGGRFTMSATTPYIFIDSLARPRAEIITQKIDEAAEHCVRSFEQTRNVTDVIGLLLKSYENREASGSAVCGNTENEEVEMNIGTFAHNAAEQAEEFVRKMWKNCHFHALPQWLQDNDFLHSGHRPPLNSFWACFQSIFRVHTETVNIWTHLLGCIGFMGIAVYFLARPSTEIKLQEKIIFMFYFAGTIICLGLSSAFHTLHCHSEWVGKLFSKLDYCGIAVLIMFSFIPWLYYGFYCHLYSKIAYLTIVILLGVLSMVVSLSDKFSKPHFRPFRAGVFISFGLSGVIPALHFAYVEGWFNKIALASLGWLSLMGSLYIIGALIYAMRIPERFFPGKCDIWFQSHQIFHVFVIVAAFVHYHGITEMAMHRMSVGECQADMVL